MAEYGGFGGDSPEQVTRERHFVCVCVRERDLVERVLSPLLWVLPKFNVRFIFISKLKFHIENRLF